LERIASVNFVGNTIASDERLKTQIKSKPGFLWVLFGGKVDRKQMDEDVERLTAYYRSLGFFNARIGRELQFNEAGTWLSLSFVIDEGPRYVVRNVTVMGNEKFSTHNLLGKTELHSGDYFNLAKMNRDVRTLLDEYGSRGHIFADVQADPRFLEEPGELDLVYSIKEGGVWRAADIDVHIEGEHPHTRESVVLNRLSVRPGDIIDSRELRASERRLKYSQLFQNDQATGTSPQVVVRPPELQEPAENIAEGSSPRSGAYRGQSPDGWWSGGVAGWGDGVVGWWSDGVVEWWADVTEWWSE
jgi:outer membrane protein insertion porin family